MSVPVLTFFNNKGGVGKTSLIYHLAWMFAELNLRVVAADLDPQANLTAAFLDEDEIEVIWSDDSENATIYQCIEPLMGTGGVRKPSPKRISRNLHLLPGDVALSGFEDMLSQEWPKSMDGKTAFRALSVLTSLGEVMQSAAKIADADVVFVDIGPNLGAINRSVLLATDYVVIPLAADLFSLQGLKNLGPTLREWREEWSDRVSGFEKSKNRSRIKNMDLYVPEGRMEPLGYLCQQYGVRLDRPVKAYDRWIQRIPAVYREYVADEEPVPKMETRNDPYCIGTIKHYRSLVPMALECRKPIFKLTNADGAIGSHAHSVREARKDFELLAREIAGKMGLAL